VSARFPEPPDFAASQLFLRRLAYSLVRDAAQAEDLVQDTWAAWVEHRPGTLADPRAWMARVLRNRAFNVKRSDARRAAREELAGRPDPSEPETEGTLEAQAQLLEALRRLEEPYRSTLVQRYYHDLAPREIAERGGTPLNTVKARLARGLERLRTELDRRYGGDRKAWCHWLTVLGAPAATVPPGSRGAPPSAGRASVQGAPWAPVAPAGGLVGKAILLGVLALSGLGWILWRNERPPLEATLPASAPRADADPASELSEPRRVPVARSRPAAPRSAPAATPEPERPPAFPAALPFEWPQLAGTPAHLGAPGAAELRDHVLHPVVRFQIGGLSGQPTIRGTDLYSGGENLVRIDLTTDHAHLPERDVLDRIRKSRGRTPSDDAWRAHGLGERAVVAAAPALWDTLVIARMTGDGSVSAFDRDLVHEVWRWEPEEPAPCPLSGCLVGDRFVFAHGRRVVALEAGYGAEAWSFEADGEVLQVPASDGELVYFGTVGGSVFALDLSRGGLRWFKRADAGFLGRWPVALSDRMLLVDFRPGPRWKPMEDAHLRAWQSYDGRELWSAALGDAPSSPGASRTRALVADAGLRAWSLESGEAAWSFRSSQKQSGGGAAAAPVVVGDSLVAIEGWDALVVRDAEDGSVRWLYRADQGVALLDFVHAGDQVYVATSKGLVCIADQPGSEAVPKGYVLTSEDSREPGRRR